MADIRLRKIDEVWLSVQCDDPGLHYELSDYFSFKIENWKFHPKVKAGIWDGRIRLYHIGKRQLYRGLKDDVYTFAKERDYTVEEEGFPLDADVSLLEIKNFLSTLKLPFQPAEHQLKPLIRGARKGRMTTLSPTSSGKSFIQYLLYRWFNKKTLLIVPNKSLISQMISDFEEYGLEEEVHVMSSAERYSDYNLTISTWQNLQSRFTKNDIKQILSPYECIFVDECHQAAAKEISYILENANDIKYRFGFTGTLQDSKANPTVIKGLLGPIYQDITTAQLMEIGFAAKLKIKALVLKYPEEMCKQVSKMSYQEEIDFICSSDIRNKFIKNLAASLEGNTLILFDYVEKHGRVIERYLREHIKNKNIYWISGATDVEEREEIRKMVDSEKNCILLASKKSSGTGMSIKHLHNIIFASPRKAKIENLQNIGRGLRKGAEKEKMTLFDIVDNFQYKKTTNYTLDHFLERVKIYDEEEFNVKTYNIEVK